MLFALTGNSASKQHAQEQHWGDCIYKAGRHRMATPELRATKAEL